MDVHSQKQRSFNMSRIRGKDTRPEMMIRRFLWANGYRYRLHRKDLPGKPDIVLTKFSAVIFVHGCFWHRHGCPATTTPATNREFWQKKFMENIDRDRLHIDALIKQGWRVMIIWECRLKGKNFKPDSLIQEIQAWLMSDSAFSCLESGNIHQ